MLKTEMLRARIEPHLKHDAEKIFKELGVSTTQAITMFYRQVIMHHGLPFEAKIPNKKTQEALCDAILNRNLTKYKSVEDLKKKFS